MSQYEMLSPNQLIKLLESKDKALHKKDKTLQEKDKIIAEQDALWTTAKAREYRYQGEKGRKFAHKLETFHIIMTTPEDLHACTEFQIHEFSWASKRFRESILDHEDKMPLFDIESS